ncbi:hypothetical protein [Pseudonocardia alaniniphila]|uniref:Uncharacterized protein n=1 Tax=Pseudonocardia alaniniphila TaxID=75291 RepID=A0ABS9T8Q2_9PSEU|nr:hypothetical protein [Pseudonocardia alaniniphila]MCH6164907.1 hypothetical protein [Pseudonocardia alaniniphila]
MAVVVIVLIFAVLAFAGFAAARVRRRKEEENRLEAAEHRHEAEIRSASAERREAEASERAARARHEEAQAREQAARAQQDRDVAEERRSAADRIDPDVPRGPDDNRGEDAADSTRDGDPAVRTDRINLGNGGGAQAAPDPAGRTDRITLDERSQHNADPASRTDRMNVAEGQAAGSGVAHEGTGREASEPAAPPVSRSVVGGTEPGRADVPAGTQKADRPGAEPGTAEPTGTSLPSRRSGEHDQPLADLDPAGQCTIPPSGGQPDPAHDQAKDADRSPVRAIADRLLGRGR